MWLDDLVTLMHDQDVATLNVDLLTSSTSPIPEDIIRSGEAVLVIVETNGGGAERTQNSTLKPAYLNVAAQFSARAKSYAKAKEMCQAAYNALHEGVDELGDPVPVKNCWIIREGGLMSGWYREIVPEQEPFDPGGRDDRGHARCVFNVRAVRRNY